jgi:hypothetical protein
MTLGRTDYDAPMVFAAVLTMAGITIAGYVLATLLEQMLLAWE